MHTLTRAKVHINNNILSLSHQPRGSYSGTGRSAPSLFKPGAAIFQQGTTHHKGTGTSRQNNNYGKTHGQSICPAKSKKSACTVKLTTISLLLCRKKTQKQDNSRKINDFFSDPEQEDQYFVDFICFDQSKIARICHHQCWATIHIT